MPKIITGLDIGSSEVKGVVVSENKGGGFSVLSVFKEPSSGFRRGILVDQEEAVRVLRKIVLDLKKIDRSAPKNVFINVNSEHIKTKFSRGIAAVARADHEIQEDDVQRAIESAGAVKPSPNHVVLHHITREYFIDDVGEIQDPIGMTGNRLEVDTVIVEAFAPHMKLLLKCLKQVGIDIGGLVFNSFASSQAVLSKATKDLGVLLIDIGSGTTTIAVYGENKIRHAKSFPVGSGYLTNDIAIGFKTSIGVAEKMKLTHGYALSKNVSRRDIIKLADFDEANQNEISKRFLSEIIEVRLEELFELINNELKPFEKSQQLPAGAVLVGAGVKLGGLTELARERLKLPVQIGIPNLDLFETENPVHGDSLSDPEFATAVGLVLSSKSGGKKLNGFFRKIIGVFRNLMP